MSRIAHHAVAVVCCVAPLIPAAATRAASQPRTEAASVLWRDPGQIGDKNFLWGGGGPEGRPAPPFTFVKEDTSGTKPKVRVADAKGMMWNVKFPAESPQKNEVHAEVAANRLAWALGYVAEEDYFIPSGRIEGVRDLKRQPPSLAKDGSFRIARFERRSANVERTGRRWTFDANPFAGSPELSGVRILLALVNNWDNKPDNTVIDRVTLPDGRIEEWFMFSDWGASFGRMAGPPGWTPPPTRWTVDHYKEGPFVKGVANGMVDLQFVGQIPIGLIPIEHARWFAGLAGALRLHQARAAFEAAGATATDAEGFASRLLEKIAELQAAVGRTTQEPSAVSHQASASHQPSGVSQPSAISHQPSGISHDPLALSERSESKGLQSAFGQCRLNPSI